MAKRMVAYGVAVVFLASLVGGCVADAMNKEDWKVGRHTDYYLGVIPVMGYCLDPFY